MDPVPSLTGASDDSSCDVSAGPATPDSSPLFGPLPADDIVEKRLSHFFTDYRPRNAAIPRKRSGIRIPPRRRASLAHREIQRICFIGAGYVGGPTAAVIAVHNPTIRIEVLDKDQNRIKQWKSPHLPIHEPGLDQVVRVARDGADEPMQSDHNLDSDETDINRAPNLFFTSDLQKSISNADIIFLAVNTPTKTFGIGAGRATDTAALDGAVQDIAAYARPETIIVEKSTVPCGTARRVRQVLSALRPGVPFEILSNPEFLAEGTAVENLMNPDRVLIGCSDTPTGHCAAAALASVYTSWVPRSRILETNVWSSELSKLVANAMLAQRISSMNSIAAICERTGADVNEIASSIGLDPRIGPKFLKAGLGFGGSCFRKDTASLTYLAESLGLGDVAEYWSQVNLINEQQRQRFTRRVVQRLDATVIGKKITLLGFAFKKNTGDTRESLAVDVIRLLLEERPAEVAIFDPYCRAEDIRREVDSIETAGLDGKAGASRVNIYNNPYEACSLSDAVLIVTDGDQFRNTPAMPRTQRMAATPRASIETPSDRSSDDDDKPEVLELNSKKYHLLPLKACRLDCQDCHRDRSGRPRPTEQLDWPRVASSLKEPRRVFDGRGILVVSEMEALGVRVDSIGRRSSEDDEMTAGLY